MTLKVAVIGRPNVGKSTLFNRLVGRKLAIVHDKPGVTRDRKEAAARFKNLDLCLIDTAGFEDAKENSIEQRMLAQTKRAINESDVVYLCLTRAPVCTRMMKLLPLWFAKAISR